MPIQPVGPVGAGRDFSVPAPGPPRRSRPAGCQAASAQQPPQAAAAGPAARSGPLKTPQPPLPGAQSSRPAGSLPGQKQKSAPPCPLGKTDHAPGTRLHQPGISLRPAERAETRRGCPPEPRRQRRGPLAYFRLRVRPVGARGGTSASPPAVFPAATPGCGLVRILSHGIRLALLPRSRGLPAYLCGGASFQVRTPRPRSGRAPGLGREHTPLRTWSCEVFAAPPQAGRGGK